MPNNEFVGAEGFLPTIYTSLLYTDEGLRKIQREIEERGFKTIRVRRYSGTSDLIFDDEGHEACVIICTTPDYFPTIQIEKSKEEIVRIKNERECIQRAYNKEIVRLDKAQTRESEKIKEAQKKLRDLKGKK